MSVTFSDPASTRAETITFEDGFSHTFDPLEVNLANGNAFALMEWLGMVPEEYGSIPAKRLRVLIGRRIMRGGGDDGTATVETRGAHGASLITCGREAGYFEDRARKLLALAEAAGEDGTITWG